MTKRKRSPDHTSKYINLDTDSDCSLDAGNAPIVSPYFSPRQHPTTVPPSSSKPARLKAIVIPSTSTRKAKASPRAERTSGLSTRPLPAAALAREKRNIAEDKARAQARRDFYTIKDAEALLRSKAIAAEISGPSSKISRRVSFSSPLITGSTPAPINVFTESDSDSSAFGDLGFARILSSPPQIIPSLELATGSDTSDTRNSNDHNTAEEKKDTSLSDPFSRLPPPRRFEDPGRIIDQADHSIYKSQNEKELDVIAGGDRVFIGNGKRRRELMVPGLPRKMPTAWNESHILKLGDKGFDTNLTPTHKPANRSKLAAPNRSYVPVWTEIHSEEHGPAPIGPQDRPQRPDIPKAAFVDTEDRAGYCRAASCTSDTTDGDAKIASHEHNKGDGHNDDRIGDVAIQEDDQVHDYDSGHRNIELQKTQGEIKKDAQDGSPQRDIGDTIVVDNSRPAASRIGPAKCTHQSESRLWSFSVPVVSPIHTSIYRPRKPRQSSPSIPSVTVPSMALANLEVSASRMNEVSALLREASGNHDLMAERHFMLSAAHKVSSKKLVENFLGSLFPPLEATLPTPEDVQTLYPNGTTHLSKRDRRAYKKLRKEAKKLLKVADDIEPAVYGTEGKDLVDLVAQLSVLMANLRMVLDVWKGIQEKAYRRKFRKSIEGRIKTQKEEEHEKPRSRSRSRRRADAALSTATTGISTSAFGSNKDSRSDLKMMKRTAKSRYRVAKETLKGAKVDRKRGYERLSSMNAFGMRGTGSVLVRESRREVSS